MKTWHWILLIGAIGVGGWLLFKNWTKIPIIKKIGEAKLPNFFTRKDEFGDVKWYKDESGLYWADYQYRMMMGIPQVMPLSAYIEAYKS